MIRMQEQGSLQKGDHIDEKHEKNQSHCICRITQTENSNVPSLLDRAADGTGFLLPLRSGICVS